MKITSFLGLLLLPILAIAQPVTWSELPLPAGPDSTTPALAASRDGGIYASWTEPRGEDVNVLLVALYDRELDQWSAPTVAAQGTDWVINWADTPTLTAGLRGRLAVTWPVRGAGDDHAYYTMVSTSTDHGKTWAAAVPLSTESPTTEFASLAALLNGDWLAVWLDGRAKPASDNMQLYSRIIGSDGPDTLVDNRVCDCCSLSTLVLPTGAVLTAYRDRSATEIRDMAFASFSRGQWTSLPFPAADNWKIEGCPVNGPALSRRGAQIAVAWYTAADEKPLVRIARSTDIGKHWNLVKSVSDPDLKPRGAVSSAVLRDGAQWTTWVESNGAIALRGINARGELGAISRLTNTTSAGTRAGGTPRMVVVDNRSDQPARLLVIRTDPGDENHPGRVTTHLASIAVETLSETLDDCGCSVEAEARGHPIRGVIEDLMGERGALLVAHEEIPGVMMATTMMFQVDPRVIPLVNKGETILARIEQREDGKWWLFSIRTTPAQN